MHYEYRQPATALLLAMAAVVGIMFLTILIVPTKLAWVIAMLMMPAAIICSSLTIQVDAKTIKWFFGAGFFKRTISFANVVSARRVQIKWYFGLGQQLRPKRELYSTVGVDAVELKLKNNKVVLLGINDAEALIAAIHDARKY